jgi:glycosyltransferase involved in cell wall biosynthesis
MTIRALFLTSYPNSAAATRLRFTQFFPYLEREGISCELVSFLSEPLFRDLYRSRNVVAMGARLALRTARYLIGIPAISRADVVIVQRNAMLFGPPIAEWLIARALRIPLVYDFDEAIWITDQSMRWGRWTSLLKFRAKTRQIIGMARHVIVGNDHVRDYVLRYRRAEDVTVIPMVVDVEQLRPAPHDEGRGPLTVGWVGTHSTARYLGMIAGPLAACARRHDIRLKIVGAGPEFRLPEIDVENKEWRLEEEVADFQHLDIGIYPVADDEWGRGKSGLKPVSYMACEVPCISSPVGGVNEFLVDGVNGLFARTADEWESALERLLSDAGLRRALGRAGRQTVVEGYSVQVHAPRFADVIRSAARS